MWIPTPIYEQLPRLYAVGGVACLATLRLAPQTVFSALVLFTAAGLTFVWRRQARQPEPPGPDDSAARRAEADVQAYLDSVVPARGAAGRSRSTPPVGRRAPSPRVTARTDETRRFE